MKRIFHPYWKWEEVKHNMWGTVPTRDLYLQKAIKFTGDHILYGSFMKRVVNEWKYSCEHNLSDMTQNRKAWLGHAACALALLCPEDIVRSAWGFLTRTQQSKANWQAEKKYKYLGIKTK
jgi:hypothetical protein